MVRCAVYSRIPLIYAIIIIVLEDERNREYLSASNLLENNNKQLSRAKISKLMWEVSVMDLMYSVAPILTSILKWDHLKYHPL